MDDHLEVRVEALEHEVAKATAGLAELRIGQQHHVEIIGLRLDVLKSDGQTMLAKLEHLITQQGQAMNDPSQSSVGRELTKSILLLQEGHTQHHGRLATHQGQLSELKGVPDIVRDLVAASNRMDGALWFAKFFGVAALVTALLALGTVIIRFVLAGTKP